MAVAPDSGDGKISTNAWNAGHAITGEPNTLLGFDAMGVGTEVDPTAAVWTSADRTALAATSTVIPSRYLRESGREGLFVWSSSNNATNVTNDPQQGVYVAPASDTTGASGAWVRKPTGSIFTDWFGAKGDGVTDDGAALAAMAAFVTYQGGGVVDFRPGAPYLFDGAQTYHASPLYTYYNWPPARLYVMEFSGCTKPLIIRLNGATIRNKGGYYGSINAAGNPNGNGSPYTGNTAATPYFAMIYAHGCTGGGYIDNGALDGNIGAVVVGSPWAADTGIQLQMTGLFLQDNLPAIQVHNIDSHHHGLDCVSYDGPATAETAADEQMVLRGCRLHNSGRQALSVVGGKGGRLENCHLYQTGKNVTGSNAASISSNPAAGIDFEAEGSKIVRDWVIDERTVVEDNFGPSIVADNGDTKRITIKGKVVGTTNYSLWANKPGFVLDGAKIIGTAVNLYADENNPNDSLRAFNTLFSTSTSRSPTGTVYVVNGHLIEGGVAGLRYINCEFEKGDAALGGSGNSGGPAYISCRFTALAGTLTCYGIFKGFNQFVANGGIIGGTPGAGIVGTADSGPSEGVWSHRTGGVTTYYGATVEAQGVPLSVSSTNSNTAKIALKDNGVVRSYLGTGNASGFDFVIFNADGSPAVNVHNAADARLFETVGGIVTRTASARYGITTGAQVFYDATNGGSFTGGGSSYDLNLGNKTGAIALRIPTGTQDTDLLGQLKFSGTAIFSAAGVLQAAGFPALTGDVTTSAGALATTIAANVVTYAKFQQVAASSLVGNATGSLANATGITLAADHAFSGTTLQLGAFTGDITKTAGSLATTIGNNAVTYAKFQTVAALSVVGNSTNATANAAAITGTDGQVLRVSGTALGFGTVAAAAMPALTGDVTTSAGAVATTLATNIVTYAKFQQVAASSLVGNATGSLANATGITLAGGLAFSGSTLTAAGALTPTSVASTGAVTSSSATAGVGYASGARGTQSQATSKATGVTSNTAVTDITLNAAALAASTTVSFVFTNSAIAANDTLVLNHVTTGTFGSYTLNAHGFAAGSCTIDVRNVSLGSLSEAIVIRAVLVKGG